MVFRAFLVLLLIRSIKAVKLSEKVIPSRYNVVLHTDIGQGLYNYTGRVKIDVDVLESIVEIVLHISDLTVQQIDVSNSSGHLLRRNLNFSESEGLSYIILSPQLNPGAYSLEIWFDGFIRNDSLGFFAREYLDEKGDKNWMAATNFHSTYARFAFPCFDESQFSAKFSLEVKHDKKYFAVSSTEVRGQNEIDKFVITTFEETFPLPTYAFGFAILPIKQNEMNVNKTHRIHSVRPVDALLSAMIEGDKIISRFELILGKPKVPKLDQIIIPGFDESPYGFQPCGIMLANEKHIMELVAPDKEARRLEMMISFAQKYAVNQMITIGVNPRN